MGMWHTPEPEVVEVGGRKVTLPDVVGYCRDPKDFAAWCNCLKVVLATIVPPTPATAETQAATPVQQVLFYSGAPIGLYTFVKKLVEDGVITGYTTPPPDGVDPATFGEAWSWSSGWFNKGDRLTPPEPLASAAT